mmetsp:Transcript_15777/g.21958  ORF Transcript_15777/g.21958 Transcript_15777/m.21958 type:complete len:298 (-) Transcript_15777:1611-2504(-)
MASPELKSNLGELSKVVKDTQFLQKRFQKLKSQVTTRLGDGKGDDEQIIIDMKKFSHLVKIYQNAYAVSQSGQQCSTACLSNLDTLRQARKRGTGPKSKVMDPEDLDLDYAQVERLSPPLSPSAFFDKTDSLLGDSKKRKERDDVGGSANGSRKRPRQTSASGKKGSRQSKIIAPSTTVAARIPSTSRKEAPTWILASILQYLPAVDKYQVQDEDVEGDQTYKVDPSSVVVLTGNTSNYDKGSEVMAMFPDTTSFYPASVVRKIGDSVSVKFADDENENGRTPSRKVETKYVFVLDK